MGIQQTTAKRLKRLGAVIEREFQTIIRTRTLLAMAGGFFGLVFGLAWTSGVTGYLPLVLDLLTPVELLIPVLVFGFAYRSILDDRKRGELDIIRTYPLGDRSYIAGVYLGRAIAVLIVLLGSLLLPAVLVYLFGGAGSTVIASHRSADSFILYLRFVVLSSVFALVVMAIAVAVSAVATTARSSIGLTVAVLLVLVVGIDLGIVVGLAAGLVPDTAVQWLLALSPTSAYRGLVFELVVGSTVGGSVPAAHPIANVLALVGWWIVMLWIASTSL